MLSMFRLKQCFWKQERSACLVMRNSEVIGQNTEHTTHSVRSFHPSTRACICTRHDQSVLHSDHVCSAWNGKAFLRGEQIKESFLLQIISSIPFQNLIKLRNKVANCKIRTYFTEVSSPAYITVTHRPETVSDTRSVPVTVVVLTHISWGLEVVVSAH